MSKRTKNQKNRARRPQIEKSVIEIKSSHWQLIDYGMHRGRTVPELILWDPAYFYWALGTKTFFKGRLAAQAQTVARRAGHILPDGDPGEAFLLGFDRRAKLTAISIGSSAGLEQLSHGRCIQMPHLNLGIVRQFARRRDQNDAVKVVTDFICRHFFGKVPGEISRGEANQFFDNSENFDIDCRCVHSLPMRR